MSGRIFGKQGGLGRFWQQVRGPRMLFFLFIATVVMLGIVLGVPLLKSDTVKVNPQDPKSPQYPYRYDELALLKLSLDDIVRLEQAKDYRTLYDHASHSFRSQVPVRNFLEMGDCVEQYLGPILSYDRDAQGFSRRFVKIKGFKDPQAVDSVMLKISRVGATVEQRYDFLNEGMAQYRLADLNWTSKNKQFQACIDLVREEARRHAREAKLQEEARHAAELQEQAAEAEAKKSEATEETPSDADAQLTPTLQSENVSNTSGKEPHKPAPTPKSFAPDSVSKPTEASEPLQPIVPIHKPDDAPSTPAENSESPDSQSSNSSDD